jgi:uncharacterized alpha-E superfamily protein
MNGETSVLLSRVADSVYWMARYIERAENVARYIGVNLNLQFDVQLSPARHWQPLIDTGGDTDVFRKRYGIATQVSVIQFLAYDEKNPNSICSCLRAARENARSVRETISSEMWEQVNSMYLDIQSHRTIPEPGQLLDTFRGIRLGSHLFQGITDATMTHNEAWHFVQLGRALERADKTSRILDVKYFMLLPSARDVGTPFDDIHWAAVLKSVGGFEMYRKKYGRITPRDIVEFLVTDAEFPRSIHWCVHRAYESLRAIIGKEAGAGQYASEKQMLPLRAELESAPVEAIMKSGLHQYLDGLQQKMNAIDDSLKSDFIEDKRVPVQVQAQVQTAAAATADFFRQ